MATKSNSFNTAQRNLQGFATVLRSTVCEWFLILLLLIGAVLSYLLTKFARYCHLQVPCILCSRLDNVLGNEEPEFYRNLLCSNHRSEISLLVSCEIHGKLSHAHGMCENCLLSFFTKQKANSDMQRLFLGKTGFDLRTYGQPYGLQNPLSQRNHRVPASRMPRLCLCCNKPWTPRPNCERFVQLKPSRSKATKPNIPLPRHASHRDGLKKILDKIPGSGSSCCLVKNGCDPLSHVGYTEVKMNSESESEIHVSEDDDGSRVVYGISEDNEELVVQHASRIPPRIVPVVMLSDSEESGDVKFLAPDVTARKGLLQVNRHQAVEKINHSQLPQLISVDDIPPSSTGVEVLLGVSASPQHSCHPALTDIMSLVDTSPVINIKEVSFVASGERFLSTGGTRNDGNIPDNKNEGASRSDFERDQLGTNSADPDDMHKSAGVDASLCGGEREPSRPVAEQSNVRNAAGNEDTESLLQKDSPGQGIHLPSTNPSSGSQVHGDEPQKIDKSGSDGIQHMQIHVSLERNERESAGFESFDASSVCEIEGESIVDRLKRQVEYDCRCISELYKELEEERNAAATAAHEAMAMITKLQAEKAALKMEALQYLRLMEEQSDYDIDALEKANDLLAEKEKEIQDLEAELDYYRVNYLDDPAVGMVSGENASIEHTVSCN